MIQKKEKNSKKSIAALIVFGVIGMIGGGIMFAVPFLLPKEVVADLNFPLIPSETAGSDTIYSDLTGNTLKSLAEKTAPTFCVQTPNGTDGARPQAGLNEAGVVFEAIAEAGITRFAAIYQNPGAAVIGPIRSLRLYYLQWDTPFDCTIVHAGGADDALEAVRYGGYKDLSENYAYMYRGSYGGRLWNNLFTTGWYLKEMAKDYGYETSNVKGFSRMTPQENLVAKVDATVSEKLVITEPAAKDTSIMAPKVTTVRVNFGGWASFNVEYDYDSSSNKYFRSYETGAAHEVYECPDENLGEVNPEDSCTLKQLAPAVVVAMFVEEHKAADNYHEDITAVGPGEAYVFQNGVAVHGTWDKAGVNEQIKFYDESGKEIRLAPGQTFVEAVPRYGSVEF